MLTVNYLTGPSATTSGANGGATYFQELSGTALNPIGSFSLSPSAFIRYDDLGFTAASPASVPEPTSTALVLGGVAMLALLRLRQRKLNIRG